MDTKNENQANSLDQGQINLDIYEGKHELLIFAPIAGVKIQELSVTVTEDVLTIQGFRPRPTNLQESELIVEECFWGSFSRSIVLPENADGSKIQASFKDNVLRISIPKNAGHKTKLVKIKID